jgi:hypothetical protein
MHNSACVAGVDIRGDNSQHLLYFCRTGKRFLRTIEPRYFLHCTVYSRHLPQHAQSVAYLPRLALRTNSNLLASFQRPPFPRVAAQYLLHITRSGKPNLHLSQRQHMPVMSLWSRIFPALRSTRNTNACTSHAPESRRDSSNSHRRRRQGASLAETPQTMHR